MNNLKCLLCLVVNEIFFQIDEEQVCGNTVHKILSKHFKSQFDFDLELSLTSKICTSCLNNVKRFYKFYTRIEQIHIKNNEILSKEANKANSLQIDLDVVKNEPICSSTEDEVTELAQAEDTKSETKTKTIEMNDMIDCNNINDENDSEDNVNKNNSVDVLDINVTSEQNNAGDNMKNKRQQSMIKVQRKRRSPSACSTSSSNRSSSRDSSRTPKSSIKRKRKVCSKQPTPHKLMQIEDNAKISKYVNMDCSLCGHKFHSFSDAKQHYRAVHDQNGYVMCCDKKFFKLTRAVQHYTWHENPLAFTCSVCHKSFMDNVCLKEHQIIHIPEKERPHKCDLCGKSFLRQHMLTSHKKYQHSRNEDKKFICDICGQKFILKAFLRSHIQRVHENSNSRICDICAKFFKAPKAYENHYLVEHTTTLEKVQCELCGKWLKHALSLKDHLRQHRAAVEKCEQCDKIFRNKKSKSLHIRTVHNGYSVNYPCTVCSKIFKKHQSLKEHMTQHTGEKNLYKCTFCARTFRSSANMYAHRKRQHPKEYEENILLGNKYPF